MLVWQFVKILLFLLMAATEDNFVFAGRPSSVKELRRELQAGWDQLRQIDEQRKSYKVVHKREWRENGQTEVKSTIPIEVQMDGPNGYRFAKVEVEGEAKQTMIYARNPYYAFLITKPTGSQDWKLLSVDQKDGSDNKVDQKFFETTRRALFPLTVGIENTSLTDMIRDKGFKITKFKENGSGKVTFDFAWKKYWPILQKIVMLKGQIRADPQRFWLAEEITYTPVGVSFILKISRSVTQLGDGSELLTCQTLTDYRNVEFETFRFENYSTASFSYAPFRLNYYGLPEPVDVPSPPWSVPLYVWILIAFIGVTALAVVSRYLAKRYFAGPSSPSESSQSLPADPT